MEFSYFRYSRHVRATFVLGGILIVPLSGAHFCLQQALSFSPEDFDDHRMRLGYVILYVDDVTETISFYESAFGLKRKFVTPESDYGELVPEDGASPIAFARKDLATDSTGLTTLSVPQTTTTLPFELAFVTDNVQRAVDAAVEAGATLVKPPTAKPWGQIVAYVRDRNGFLIELCTAVAH